MYGSLKSQFIERGNVSFVYQSSEFIILKKHKDIKLITDPPTCINKNQHFFLKLYDLTTIHLCVRDLLFIITDR